jgi:hypothetical protein
MFLSPTSALGRITDSSRTSRQVRKVSNRHLSFDCANRWPRLGRVLWLIACPPEVQPSAIDPPLRYQIVISVTACPKDRRHKLSPVAMAAQCRSNKGRQS